MNRLHHIITIFCFLLFCGINLHAQCVPDTTCKDTDEPGQICPRNLPDISVGVAYEAVITVIPPSEFEIEGNVLKIISIKVDSVTNLPPGIDYTSNAEIFYADTAYCVLISGTATMEGDYNLGIFVTPTIQSDLIGIFQGPQYSDDTSVVVSVRQPTSLEQYNLNKFRVFQNAPNPFTEVTRLSYYTPVNDLIELKIYNILGVLVHQEQKLSSSGEHFFSFDGSDLLPGPYFYRVKNKSSYLTGKLIKTN